MNVARTLTALDDRPLLTGFAGGASGETLLSMLRALAIASDFVVTSAPTRICSTLIDESSASVTELVEEAPLPAAKDWESLEDKLAGLLSRDSILVGSGALPPGSPPDRYARLARIGAERDARLILDARGDAFLRALQHAPVLAKLNRAELEETYPNSTTTEDTMMDPVRFLLATGAQWVLVTDGANTAWLTNKDRTWKLTPPSVQALNAVGSGDATTAGIAHQLARGKSMVDASRFGMACGAANALTLTPGEVDVEMVASLLSQVKVT